MPDCLIQTTRFIASFCARTRKHVEFSDYTVRKLFYDFFRESPVELGKNCPPSERNANATASIVQQLARAIRFKTLGGTSTIQRNLVFTLTDGDGGTSATLNKTVDVS